MRKKAEAMPVVKAFKAFDSNFKCRGFQYEIGKTYKIKEGELPVRCGAMGFHSCENPFDVLRYYPLFGSRFAEIEAAGAIARDDLDSKIASAQITISAELRLPDFIKRAVNWIVENAKEAATTGEGANAATTGYRANAATTGYRANAVTTGEGANAVTTGYRANAVTTGYRANAATTGYRANAATTGEGANAATTGEGAVAVALGKESKVKAGKDGAIMLVSRAANGKILAVFASKVGENGVKPGIWYQLSARGELIECDSGA